MLHSFRFPSITPFALSSIRKGVLGRSGFYSCNSNGSPSGSKKNVICFPLSGSILISSVSIPLFFSSSTLLYMSSTLNARCLRPLASGRVRRLGGFFSINSSISIFSPPSRKMMKSSLSFLSTSLFILRPSLLT